MGLGWRRNLIFFAKNVQVRPFIEGCHNGGPADEWRPSERRAHRSEGHRRDCNHPALADADWRLDDAALSAAAVWLRVSTDPFNAGPVCDCRSGGL